MVKVWDRQNDSKTFSNKVRGKMYKLGPLRGKRKKFCPKCKKKDVELAESLFGQLKKRYEPTL